MVFAPTKGYSNKGRITSDNNFFVPHRFETENQLFLQFTVVSYLTFVLSGRSMTVIATPLNFSIDMHMTLSGGIQPEILVHVERDLLQSMRNFEFVCCQVGLLDSGWSLL